MVTVWRIVRSKHAGSAFSGDGARQARLGGRLNSHGTALVYTSDSYALAVLELRVHMVSFRGLRDRVVFEADIDCDMIDELPGEHLPGDCRDVPAPTSTQHIGDMWVAAAQSAVLRVPSVVVPGHHNYLLNPSHPDMNRIAIRGPFPLDVDARLR